eukprot:6491469-Amphidinium_carterae.2
MPPLPKFVHDARRRNPSIDLSIPVPTLVADIEASELSDDGVLIPSVTCSLNRRVRFSDAPGVCFAERARREEQNRPKKKIFLVEFCCESDSMLGRDTIRGDAEVLRVTRDMDVTNKTTIDGIMNMIEQKSKHGYLVHLHASTPCTGGSIIQNLNVARGMSPERLQNYTKEAKIMIQNFGALARMASKMGATISVEWPRSCKYWQCGWYCRLQRQCSLKEARFDGCMVGCAPGTGIVAKEHHRHNKAWRIDTNNEDLLRTFSNLLCHAEGRNHDHVPIEGKFTKRSGEYPPLMCTMFHRALRATWQKENTQNAVPCEMIELRGDELAESMLDDASAHSCAVQSLQCQRLCWEATARYWDMDLKEAVDANLVPALALQPVEEHDSQKDSGIEGHREFGTYPCPLGLVTETLTKSDPRYHSAEAKAAFGLERDKLNACGTWDDIPVEKSEATRKFPNATFSRVFTLLGIKGSEGTKDRKFKARSVLQGNQMIDSDGDAVFYSDSSSAPTTMAAIRAVLSYGVMRGRGATQADGTQAFVQPHLPDHVVIFAYIPPELRTQKQHEMAKSMVSPVFRLWRPLYGWACSGKLWAEHLDSKMKLCGWTEVDGWVQTYIKRVGQDTLITTVYVDDFVMAGPNHEQEWDELRKHLILGEVTPVDRVLGVQHHVFHGEATTEIKIEMSDFLKSAIERYNEIPNAPRLKDSASTPWRQHGPEEPNKMTEKGVLGPKAASLLMKILYAARMCRPDLIWTITTLARFITKWTRFHDVQLAHLYSYIQGSIDIGLVVTLPSKIADLDDAKLILYVDADHAGGLNTTKSMSGAFLTLSVGEHHMPLDWFSKLQSSTACSSTEAELIAFNRGIKQCGLGQKMLWEQLLGRTMELIVKEDNASAIRDIETGYSSQLRHVLSKVHRVSLGSLNELLSEGCFAMEYCPTDQQMADGLTKGLAKIKHEAFMRMLGLQAMSQRSGCDHKSDGQTVRKAVH